MSRDASMSSANFDSDTGVGVESEQEVESQEPKPIPPAEPQRTKVSFYGLQKRNTLRRFSDLRFI